ncbi:MAG: endolytic transglycosylase MltG [Patescibacteria group bacterium]
MENSFLPDDFGHNVGYPASSVGKIKKVVFCAVGLIVFLSLFYFLFLSAPGNFPLGTIVKIEPGMGLHSVSSILKKQHIIRSRVAFEILVIIWGGEKHIISADYLFENKLSAFEVARRVSGGKHHMAPVAVTIPEGFDVNQIGDIAALELANFNKAKFLLGAKDKEGYLFPDTYFFFNNANETDVIKSMSDNFEKKINPLLPEIISSGQTKKDIVIMASIIEREAKGEIDRGVISGILWKRISIGMPLQVDSAPETYKVKGFPESPIGNPGLEAIKAAIYPQSSPYFYYLHDKKGNIHYARNFTEHSKNVVKYLKQ